MDFFVTFLINYGIGGLITAVASYVLTELVKIPVKRYAERYAEEHGVDTIVITKWLCILPYVFAFVGALLNEWATDGWGAAICDPEVFNWTHVVAVCVACGSVTSTLYAVIENFVDSHTSSTIADYASSNEDATAKIEAAKQALADAKTEEETEKAAKAVVKAEKKAAREAEEQAKIQARKAAKIADLEAQIASLKGETPSAETVESVTTVEYIN